MAFTLIELLVVIAIIATLAALLLPALSRSKAQARSTVCASHLHQMGLALQMYVHENRGCYPYLLDRSAPASGDPALAHWFGKLLPYYPLHWTNRSYHCPGYAGRIWLETAGDAEHDPFGSYAYNWDGVRGYLPALPGSPLCLGLGVVYHPNRPTPAVSEAQIRMPGDMLAIGESRFRRETSITNFSDADCVDAMFCGYLLDRNEGGVLPERHGKNYNQLFCDGHAAAINPWVLFDPRKTAASWNSDHETHPHLWPPD